MACQFPISAQKCRKSENKEIHTRAISGNLINWSESTSYLEIITNTTK